MCDKKTVEELKYLPFPACTKKCSAIDELGVSDCENICPSKHRSWNLTLNVTQANLVSRAMELYTRLMIGQISAVLEEHTDLSWDDREAIHRFARMYIFPEHGSNGGPGICSDETSEKAKIAWDISATMRQALAWDREGKDIGKDTRSHDMYGVIFDDPMRTSNEPLPKITKE